jgi:hypothetical protein
MFLKLVFGIDDAEKVWGEKIIPATEKGYPPLFDFATYWFLYEGDVPVAYTCTAYIDSFVLVGNTYVKRGFRGKGYHTKILQERNKRIRKPFVAVLNPIEESKMSQLKSVVSNLGYIKLAYSEAKQIMSDETWKHFEGREVWWSPHLEIIN